MTQVTQWQHGTKTDMRRCKSSRKDRETWGRLSVDRRESAWLRDEEDELWMEWSRYTLVLRGESGKFSYF